MGYGFRIRNELFFRQNKKCYLCGAEMTMKTGKQNTCTVDHVVPQCRGGKEIKGACWYCNNRKGNLSAEEYLALIGRGAYYRCVLVKKKDEGQT